MELNIDYKYDTTGRYYYLTTQAVQNELGIDVDEVWKNATNRLKRQGKLLKLIMSYSQQNTMEYMKSRKDFIEYIQYKDASIRNAVLEMLLEIAQWAYDVDGDLMTYEENDTFEILKKIPFTVRSYGEQSGLIFFGKTDFLIPENEYQVGY